MSAEAGVSRAGARLGAVPANVVALAGARIRTEAPQGGCGYRVSAALPLGRGVLAFANRLRVSVLIA